MPPATRLVLLVLAIAAGAACSASSAADADLPPAVAESGGDTTVFDTAATAFARSAHNLDHEQKRAFAVGNAFFNDGWVVAPASTAGRDGLGPTFNAVSCSACHTHDGRSRPPDPGDDAPGLLARLSVPGTGAHGEPLPEPTYGHQLGDRAIPNVPAEGRLVVHRRVAREVRGRKALRPRASGLPDRERPRPARRRHDALPPGGPGPGRLRTPRSCPRGGHHRPGRSG